MDIIKDLLEKILSLDGVIIAALIAAMVSMIGSTFTARSNNRANKKRIQSEEKRARLPYLSKILTELQSIWNELNEREKKITLKNYQSKGEENTFKKIMDNNSYARDLVPKVVPYLLEENRKKLMDQYNNIEEIYSNYQVNIINGKKDEELNELIKNIPTMEIKLKSDLKKYLFDEICLIAGQLRENSKN